jgi:transposase
MQNEQLPLPEITQEDWAATPHIVLLVLMLMQYIQQLTQRIADLEARLNQHSGNSSRPPSSDPPSAPPKPPRTPRGKPKSRGGQPGHPGQHRPLLPPEQVDEIVAHTPEQCSHCTADLPADLPDAAPAQRHQVTELTFRECSSRLCIFSAHLSGVFKQVAYFFRWVFQRMPPAFR